MHHSTYVKVQSKQTRAETERASGGCPRLGAGRARSDSVSLDPGECVKLRVGEGCTSVNTLQTAVAHQNWVRAPYVRESPNRVVRAGTAQGSAPL